MDAKLFDFCTAEEYFNLPEGSYVELIDGMLYDLATPSTKHQRMVTELLTVINQFIKKNNGDCVVVPAPFSVWLNKNEETVVEPDICVVCDPNKLTERGCEGAPDWVIEIVSPSNPARDYIIKLKKYLSAGVREYWLVDFDSGLVTVYSGDLSERFPAVYTLKDKVPAGIYEDFSIDFQEITAGL